ncbi:SAM-dependent methyltransferase [Wenjunlia tyrosinilytica]|uniref:S-adenosyl methyltransferase n=1 Tax=Wenjunlia tyrosinilytica TaxID=1544741 RepID=A0A918DZ23_9ACTN|nr:SAM-dependent methyltransferase [Wenjunlia tyrosinilytica]GGO94054.1 hypothetical protein GCM10012280_48000 [Wenjunlia tyrosinilytica]
MSEDETAVDAVMDLQLDRAHSARMYDYYLGGRTNFTADREAVGRVMAVFPAALVAARANREFMHRATRFLAGSGMRQFLDIGTGIPTSPNLHEVAQRVAPECRVVYTDNDPIVLAHAQALLCSHASGRTAYAEGDVTDPEAVLSTAALRDTLDLDRPVALSLNALLHFVGDDQGAHKIVEHLKGALASGSTLAISHATWEFAPEAMERVAEVYRSAGTRLHFRSREEISRFFDGWELIEPGIVPSSKWRPDDPDDAANVTDIEAACFAGVARKL